MSALTGVPDDVLAEGALGRLRRLVGLESPSGDGAGLRAVADDFAAQLAAAGASVETVGVPGVGAHVLGRVAGAREDAPVLVLGHLDTVHAVGSFDPVFRVEDGRAYGPGAFDMKGGWACLLEALHGMAAVSSGPDRPVVVLATCDEETGSEHSRDLIEEVAAGAAAVLVLEPSLPGGGAKTRRKGVGWYTLTVRGRASHAGLAPQAGVNAVLELARQIEAASGLADADAGTTVTVGVVQGGTTPNVVPDRASATFDVRFTTAGEAERVDRALRALRPITPGARIQVDGGINRPPMERTSGIGALFDRARQLARDAGWDLEEGTSGGASDGSLTAGLGVPTLDGIGPRGGGAHAADEHVVIDDLPRRVRLYAGLLEGL
ncbi:MAG: M20 family metallopeptidase [Gemmatimonadota bacterium]